MNLKRENNQKNQYKGGFDNVFFEKFGNGFFGSVHKHFPLIPFLKLDKKITSNIDHKLHALWANFNSFSPGSIATAYYDWVIHLSISPGKQLDLLESARLKSLMLAEYLTSGEQDNKKRLHLLPKDKRFKNEAWHKWPFCVYQQAFLLIEQWWIEAVSDVRGVTQHHSDILPFLLRQFIDIFCPANIAFMNPLVLEKTTEEAGMNFVRGTHHLWEDWERIARKMPPVGAEKFKVGKNIAVTPGKVIYQNQLIELIQYSPSTDTVYAEPLLIIPAWIMKYYLLDLSPENSLVKYLVSKGHTVFMISWKNPSSQDRDLNFDSYLKLGVMDALEAISTIVPKQKIHAIGYCLGGTLLFIAAARMAHDRDTRLKTITTFAAQVDFEDAGEIQYFVDESQLHFLEDIMYDKGYLDASRIAGTFYLLRSNDLIWSRMIETYLMGERQEITDLMAWNTDSTRLPHKMHSEYLRSLYLNDDLVSGRFIALKKPVSLRDISTPAFVVSTQKDHIAPWKSVYKIHLFIESEITFVLTSGGHNGGIISEPRRPHRRYQIATRKERDIHLSPQEWEEIVPSRSGSWWPAWQKWLVAHSTHRTKPPSMGCKPYKPLRKAPGNYVFIN